MLIVIKNLWIQPPRKQRVSYISWIWKLSKWRKFWQLASITQVIEIILHIVSNLNYLCLEISWSYNTFSFNFLHAIICRHLFGIIFNFFPRNIKLPRNSRLGIRDKPIKWQHRSFITTLRRDVRTTSKRLDPLSIALFKLKTMRNRFRCFLNKSGWCHQILHFLNTLLGNYFPKTAILFLSFPLLWNKLSTNHSLRYI